MAKECTLKDINRQFTAVRSNSLGLYESCVSNDSRSYFVVSRSNKLLSFNATQREEINLDELYTTKGFDLLGVCVLAKDCSEASIASMFKNRLSEVTYKYEVGRNFKVHRFPPEDRLKGLLTIFSPPSLFFIFLLLSVFFVIFSTWMKKYLRKKLMKSLGSDVSLELESNQKNKKLEEEKKGNRKKIEKQNLASFRLY